MNDGMKAFTCRLPAGLHERLRDLSYRSRVSMNDLVAQGAQMRLELEEVVQIGSRITSPGSLYTAEVVVSGSPQLLYRAADGQVYVAGHPGAAYTVRVHNLTAGRIEVISSVDGRNTLKDEAASLSVGGLVIRPLDAYDFAGFQQDDTKASRLVFCDPGQAVAVQATGSAENVGVIGLAAYREQSRPAVELRGGYGLESYGASRGRSLSASKSATLDMAPVAMAGMPSPGLGTGMGEDFGNNLGHTSFIRSGRADVTEIRYDTEENLRAAGIIGGPEVQRPRAFPGEPTGYAGYQRV